MTVLNFERQDKAGINNQGHYQLGSNCCIGCKADRPLNQEGMWCEGCKNFQNIHKDIVSYKENVNPKS
jgi:hypothetical protein